MALGDPRLWPTNVSTSDVYRPGVCDICSTRPGSTISAGWERACAILARSAPLPLSFSSNVCAEHIAGPLAQLLKEVSGRLIDLHISGTGDLLGQVLPALHLAPALRSVSLRGKNTDTFHLPPEVDLPALERLDLDLSPGIIRPPVQVADFASRLYSKLRVASFAMDELSEVLGILDGCPGVRDVTVNIPGRLLCTEFVKPAGYATYPAAMTLRSLVPYWFDMGPGVVSALKDSFFPDVTLEFGGRSLPEEEIVSFFEPIQSAGACVLTAARVEGTDYDILVAGEAENGVRRAVVAGHRSLMIMHVGVPIGAYIPAHALVSATVHLAMWQQFTGIAGFDDQMRFPSLSALTVVIVPFIGRDSSLERTRSLFGQTTPDQFPALATLRIERMADPAGNQLLSPQWLVNFVDLMELGHRIQTIELPGCAPELLEQVRQLRLAERVE